MPKYRVAETLRVEFITEGDTPDHAVKNYLKEFRGNFGANDSIEVVQGVDLEINFVKEDGTLGDEVFTEE
jgi:hypothetical protein